MKRYVIAHWRGEQSMIRSFLVNGVLGYALCLLAALAPSVIWQPLGVPGLILLLAWAVWAVVGIVRCAFRIFRKQPQSGGLWIDRGLAAIALPVTAYFVYSTISDSLTDYRIITGAA